MLKFVDTHCHLQFDQYKANAEEVYNRAVSSGVTKMITVGTTAKDSQKAVDFAISHDGVWASVGLHPHDAKNLNTDKQQLEELVKQAKVVAVGECGLDYYYNHSPKADQIKALRFQIELALKHNLPIIFHVRDAYNDFWPIFDEYSGIRGVFHCFAAGPKELEKILERDMYVGVNGIATFSKNSEQLLAFKVVPLHKLLLETDAPFLTPTPLRGKVNESRHVIAVAEFLSKLRGEDLNLLAKATTGNARQLFSLN